MARKKSLPYAGIALLLSILTPLGCNLRQQLALVQTAGQVLHELPNAAGTIGQIAGVLGTQHPAGNNSGWSTPPSGNAAGGWQYPAQGQAHQSGAWSGTATPVQNASYVSPDKTILIGSFNIQVLGRAKLSNPDVARILIDVATRFDLLAIQELRSTEQGLIPWFVQQINALGHNYQYIVGPRQGYSISQEQYVYLYDANKLALLSQPYVAPDPQERLHRSPLVAHFQSIEVHPQAAFSFVLLNIHTDPDVVQAELAALETIMAQTRASHPGEDDFIILGDFNAWPSVMSGYRLQPSQLCLIPDEWPTNTRRSRNYDNLVIDQRATAEATGRRGVIDIARVYGLTLDQALEVSDHLPVWAEFSIFERQLQTAASPVNAGIPWRQ